MEGRPFLCPPSQPLTSATELQMDVGWGPDALKAGQVGGPQVKLAYIYNYNFN